MDSQNSNLTPLQEYLYKERESTSLNDTNNNINNNNNNNVSPVDKSQTKKQKDLSNEILYFSINQDSK